MLGLSEQITRLVRRARSLLAVAVVASIFSAGTTVAASYLVLGTSNSASTSTSLSSSVNGSVLKLTNTNSSGGTSARGLSITVPAGRAPIVVNSSAGKATYLNADRLDGRDATYFGRVREFHASTNTVSSMTPMLTFDGMTISRQSVLNGGNLDCRLYFTSTAYGHLTGVWSGFAGTSTGGIDAPFTNLLFGRAFEGNADTIGQVQFFNRDTQRVMSINFAIYRWNANAGCEWMGTVSAAP